MLFSSKTHLKTSSLSSVQLCPLHTELLGEYTYCYRFPCCLWLRSQQRIHVTLVFFLLYEGQRDILFYTTRLHLVSHLASKLHLRIQMHRGFALGLEPRLKTQTKSVCFISNRCNHKLFLNFSICGFTGSLQITSLLKKGYYNK